MWEWYFGRCYGRLRSIINELRCRHCHGDRKCGVSSSAEPVLQHYADMLHCSRALLCHWNRHWTLLRSVGGNNCFHIFRAVPEKKSVPPPGWRIASHFVSEHGDSLFFFSFPGGVVICAPTFSRVSGKKSGPCGDPWYWNFRERWCWKFNCLPHGECRFFSGTALMMSYDVICGNLSVHSEAKRSQLSLTCNVKIKS